MPILTRPYHAEQDRRAVLDLLTRARAAARYDRYPTTHRLDLLLTSRLWEPERDARVWYDDASDRLVGVALLWRRSLEHRNVTLEAFADPDAPPEDFAARALRWACMRSAELARELSHVVSIVVVVGADEHARIAFLRRHAFVLLEGYPVRMGRTLGSDSPHAPLPAGFTLRRLAAKADLARYAALYDQVFSAVSDGHRCELLLDPDYAHFVIAAADGNLVAFCECSISRAEWALGGACIGEIDYLGTLEGFQRRGLGKALLDAAFRQLQEWGAGEVSLVTGGTNDQAQRVYRHAGMEIAARACVYSLEIAP